MDLDYMMMEGKRGEGGGILAFTLNTWQIA
jgi:hypothetical protein